MKTFESFDGLESYLVGIFSQVDFSPLFKQIETLIKSSIDRNFKAGGRFGTGKFGGGSNQWVKSARSKKQSGQTLQDTGSMKLGVGVQVSYNSGQFNVTITAGKVYSAAHNFGHISRPKLPARPYLVIQDEDLEDIVELVSDYLAKQLT